MGEALKILGQLVPSINILSPLYVVPSSASASVSSLIICNQNTIQILFRISVALGGAADDPKQYLYFDVPLDGNDTFIATIGLSLASNDVVRIQSDTDNVSFNISGVEVT